MSYPTAATAAPAFECLNALWDEPERIWARTQQHTLTIQTLAGAVAQTIQRLQHQPVKRALVYRSDKAAFVRDLLACAMLGIDVVLPHNGQPDSLQQAARDAQTDWMLCDLHDDDATPPSPVDMASTDSVDNSIPAFPRLQDIDITVFTSGSTGAPKAIAKPLSAYLLEAQMLETQWRDSFAGATFLASVSHQHVYGLMFAVLVPLTYSHPMWCDVITFEERLHYIAEQLDACVFIASPSLLRHLHERQTLPTLRAVFSSGGPLSTAEAKHVERQLGAPCLRIFGSSETGAIAWQDSHHDDWTTLPAVTVTAQHGVLQVDSPYAFERPFIGSDRIQCIETPATENQRFLLLGRVDDIVKIGEKRVALPALEQALEKQPHVVQARVVALPSPRQALGAVLVLDGAGNARQRQDAKAFYQALRQSLSRQFEAVTLPKYFRCVEALPQNAQGKVLRADLLALFTEGN